MDWEHSDSRKYQRPAAEADSHCYRIDSAADSHFDSGAPAGCGAATLGRTVDLCTVADDTDLDFDSQKKAALDQHLIPDHDDDHSYNDGVAGDCNYRHYHNHSSHTDRLVPDVSDFLCSRRGLNWLYH